MLEFMPVSGSLIDTLDLIRYCVHEGRTMTIYPIPSLTDNLMYVISDGLTAIAIDPGETAPLIRFIAQEELQLAYTLITHHHTDHTAGCRELVRATGCRIAGARENHDIIVDHELNDGDTLEVDHMRIEVMAAPGHTAHHLVYHCPEANALFTGDALFVGGCGRIMGSSAATMWSSLRRLRALPDATMIYCGHNYAVDNLEFAHHIEPTNPHIKAQLDAMHARIANDQLTVPSDLATEKRTNPFLRADTDAIRAALNKPDATGLDLFTELRKRKDRW